MTIVRDTPHGPELVAHEYVPGARSATPADYAVELVDDCTGCAWPGRCKGYGLPGCRMKAEERLHVDAERVDVDRCGRCGFAEAVCPCLLPAPATASPVAGAGESLAAGAIARSLSDAAKAYRDGALAGLLADVGPWDD